MGKISIEKWEVLGFNAAIRSMRNPMDSWPKSDSSDLTRDLFLGPDDLKLACNLIKAGTEHRKFIRLIQVWVDFVLPRFIYQELDTYRVGMTRMSCSTMHRLGHRDLTRDDFVDDVSNVTLALLNGYAFEYRAKGCKDVGLLHKMKANLPEGYLQRSTMNFNYETALNIYRQRHNHKMPEWSGPDGICEWIKGLPYMAEFIEAAQSK
jgi:hypothetical protein